MSEIQVIAKNGKLLVESREVASMTGKQHKELLRDIATYIQILESANLRSQEFFIESDYKSPNNHKSYKCYLLTRKGCDMVANKMTGTRGVLFTAAYVTKFEELEKQQVSSQVTNEIERKFNMTLVGIEYSTKLLRMDDTSTARMLETAHKTYGLPTDHLPQYIDAEVTKSLTALIKQFDVGLTAVKFNEKLIELGLLEIKQRSSSKGGTKNFKSLTEDGCKYGKNLINPRNPKETQPHYYESKFLSLINEISRIAS